MKKIIGTAAFTVGVTSLVILAALVWIVDRREIKDDTTPLEKSIKGIRSVGVQYDKEEIFLNVQTDTDLNCADIFRLLDIGPIIVKNKIYLPKCNTINERLIEVEFKSEEVL